MGVPECQIAISQKHVTASASVCRPFDLCRQPKDAVSTLHHACAPRKEPRLKEPSENALSYAAVATSESSIAVIGDCARETRGRSVVVSEPLSKSRYEGKIKWFRGTYGWVYSPGVQTQYPGVDVFLHINDCGDGLRPKQGDAVTFLLSEDEKGNPKAVRARPPPVMTDAREWFEKRQKSAMR